MSYKMLGWYFIGQKVDIIECSKYGARAYVAQAIIGNECIVLFGSSEYGAWWEEVSNEEAYHRVENKEWIITKECIEVIQ